MDDSVEIVTAPIWPESPRVAEARRIASALTALAWLSATVSVVSVLMRRVVIWELALAAVTVTVASIVQRRARELERRDWMSRARAALTWEITHHEKRGYQGHQRVLKEKYAEQARYAELN